jgi:hypothetical protein
MQIVSLFPKLPEICTPVDISPSFLLKGSGWHCARTVFETSPAEIKSRKVKNNKK